MPKPNSRNIAGSGPKGPSHAEVGRPNMTQALLWGSGQTPIESV